MGNPEPCCSLSIPLPVTSTRKSSFQQHPTASLGRGWHSRDAVLPHRAHERCRAVPGTLCCCPEMLLELPCLAWAVLHPLSSLPQQKHHIQITLVIISSRKEFIWVWVRKEASCWLPDPLSGPDLFTEIAQPAKYLTPGIRGSLSCKKDLRR